MIFLLGSDSSRRPRDQRTRPFFRSVAFIATGERCRPYTQQLLSYTVRWKELEKETAIVRVWQIRGGNCSSTWKRRVEYFLGFSTTLEAKPKFHGSRTRKKFFDLETVASSIRFVSRGGFSQSLKSASRVESAERRSEVAGDERRRIETRANFLFSSLLFSCLGFV